MPWTESRAMDNRLIFIAACLREDEPMSDLSQRHGISRKTGYKWLGRYRQAGVSGLEALSRARHTLEHAVDLATETRIVAYRKDHPKWGPRKLLAELEKLHPETNWPAASTMGDRAREGGDLLRRRGKVEPRKRQPGEPRAMPALTTRRRRTLSGRRTSKAGSAPGTVRCEPFTVCDGFSRYILACQAVAQVTVGQVQPILTRLFQTHGLPQRLRTDNGSPFARRDGLGGLTQLCRSGC